MKKKLITKDDFKQANKEAVDVLNSDKIEKTLKLVGAFDISYDKRNNGRAIGALVICEYPSMKVVYEDYIEKRNLHEKYMPGFLAFRETPIYEVLFQRLKKRDPRVFPQVMLVDGNGTYHHRGFGCACHVGVSFDVPTIGVSKNPLDVDGIRIKEL